LLDAPLDVHRGENVGVEARCGAARLLLDGVAQSDGRVGQVVAVRNPGSGKNFQARVEGKGKVAVNGGGCR
jgi:flagella basal body P-ring formation protein FlgA